MSYSDDEQQGAAWASVSYIYLSSSSSSSSSSLTGAPHTRIVSIRSQHCFGHRCKKRSRKKIKKKR